MWSNIQELFNPESILFTLAMNHLALDYVVRYLILNMGSVFPSDVLLFKVINRFSFWAIYKFNNFTFTGLIIFAFVNDVGEVRRDQSLNIMFYFVFTRYEHGTYLSTRLV